jgi:aminoglycoside 6'-N-acetyltransferase I
MNACVAWAREQGYREMGSDALIDNLESHRLHRKFGFEETDRVVQFKRNL